MWVITLTEIVMIVLIAGFMGYVLWEDITLAYKAKRDDNARFICRVTGEAWERANNPKKD